MRTRFAPAPTGYLHLGHLANALMVWGVAQARGAEVLLRIEDHDRQRCRPEYEAALLADLAWLGLVPDLPPLEHFGRGPTPYRQSDNNPAYRAAVAELRAAGHQVYACDCSRKALLERTGDRPLAGEGAADLRYDGFCRDRGLAPAAGRGLRLRLPDEEIGFTDQRMGAQRQHPSAQCGDLLLQDRLGNWTYQFAVTVDDRDQRVDLVVRGEDLLPSTGRQILLARMLGRRTPPAFLHHGLLRKPGGAKLSKADGDTSLRELRAAGATAAQLAGQVLGQLGVRSPAPPETMQDALTFIRTLA